MIHILSESANKKYSELVNAYFENTDYHRKTTTEVYAEYDEVTINYLSATVNQNIQPQTPSQDRNEINRNKGLLNKLKMKKQTHDNVVVNRESNESPNFDDIDLKIPYLNQD
jgi:copper oxidase (laccase) domain-containing protein